ncbi:hypothetical protein [Crassaminicella profunda]|uniref:hypothetical protein n=1 Tax=Crassaminicella profunda TaxID=1286698 RepID=UPI001CA639FE|nr:hypothetical protein [Crassaminicella profunda]QZY53700.1 hypothetical protein K7H06_11575 [Crassaminicella profunda]
MTSTKNMKSWETMKTWPKKIQSYEEVPEMFKEHFQLFEGDEQFPDSIFIPPNKWSTKNKVTKLISVFDDRVCIYEEINQKVEMICYSFEDIYYTEIGSVLLDSWIKISGEVHDELKSSMIGFNTARDDLFLPIIKKIRTSISNVEPCDMQNELSKFDYLKTVDLKFLNYSKQSILSGQKVMNVVYQNEICEKHFKYFSKRKTNAHIVILTKNELIMIREDYELQKDKNSKYGGVWNYIPLTKIKEIKFEKKEDEEVYIFSVNLLNNEPIEAICSPSNKTDIDLLINEFYHLTNQ